MNPAVLLNMTDSAAAGAAEGRLPVPSAAAIFKAMDEGGVVFASDSEMYYGLNGVGARVWELLPPATATLDELVTKLSDTYPEVEAQVIRADVTELLDQLLEYGLLVPQSA